MTSIAYSLDHKQKGTFQGIERFTIDMLRRLLSSPLQCYAVHCVMILVRSVVNICCGMKGDGEEDEVTFLHLG
jgi:hypothetical protein